jgi:hypothetical protein
MKRKREKFQRTVATLFVFILDWGWGEGYSAHCQMPRKMCVCVFNIGEKGKTNKTGVETGIRWNCTEKNNEEKKSDRQKRRFEKRRIGKKKT